MKLISLNIWGGKVYGPLIDFLKKHSEDVDIFCFQEVFNTPSERNVETRSRVKIFSEIDEILKDLTGHHAPIFSGWTLSQKISDSVHFGLATFVRKNIPIDSLGDFFVYGKLGYYDGKEPTTIPRNVQYARLKIGGAHYTICNFHGYWEPNTHKEDTKERIAQSKKILRFLNKEKTAKILCGDFNLAPHTESLRILEKGMRNLVKEYGVTSTRSRYYEKDMKFADYILVSPEVEVKDFKVMPDVVSDHLPLYLEFS